MGCRCECAVITAYGELTGRGVADLSAFHACTTLYRIHHPASSLREARAMVSEWIDQRLQGEDGGLHAPCPGDDRAD